eukprot:8980831-Pyramimonas_sp.AAC.1
MHLGTHSLRRPPADGASPARAQGPRADHKAPRDLQGATRRKRRMRRKRRRRRRKRRRRRMRRRKSRIMSRRNSMGWWEYAKRQRLIQPETANSIGENAILCIDAVMCTSQKDGNTDQFPERDANNCRSAAIFEAC